MEGGGDGWEWGGAGGVAGRAVCALGWALDNGLDESGPAVRTHGGCSFLLGAFQSVMDAAHSFLSLGRSCCSDWRSRSASVAKVRKASTRSNFSDDGAPGAIMAAASFPSARPKSRATEPITSTATAFFGPRRGVT